MYKYDQIWVGTAALQFMGLENHLCSLETLIININGKKKIILVGISISQDFKCIVQMLISIVIIRVQGSNLRGGMDFQNRWGGPPKFWVLLHFYVTISKFFPILTSLRKGRGWGLQGLRRGSYPPPFGHVWSHCFPEEIIVKIYSVKQKMIGTPSVQQIKSRWCYTKKVDEAIQFFNEYFIPFLVHE